MIQKYFESLTTFDLLKLFQHFYIFLYQYLKTEFNLDSEYQVSKSEVILHLLPAGLHIFDLYHTVYLKFEKVGEKTLLL